MFFGKNGPLKKMSFTPKMHESAGSGDAFLTDLMQQERNLDSMIHKPTVSY